MRKFTFRLQPHCTSVESVASAKRRAGSNVVANSSNLWLKVISRARKNIEIDIFSLRSRTLKTLKKSISSSFELKISNFFVDNFDIFRYFAIFVGISILPPFFAGIFQILIDILILRRYFNVSSKFYRYFSKFEKFQQFFTKNEQIYIEKFR